MILDIIKILTLPTLTFTGFALLNVEVNQKATYARYVIGQGVTSVIGLASATFLMNSDSRPWATLVCGLSIYTLVHTAEINGTNRSFKAALFAWALLILLAAGFGGLGWDTAVSLVLAVFFDYILACYKKWLVGNPALAEYQGRREISAQERVKSLKVLRKAHKKGVIGDFEYQTAKVNRTYAHHKNVDSLREKYLERMWGDVRD